MDKVLRAHYILLMLSVSIWHLTSDHCKRLTTDGNQFITGRLCLCLCGQHPWWCPGSWHWADLTPLVSVPRTLITSWGCSSLLPRSSWAWPQWPWPRTRSVLTSSVQWKVKNEAKGFSFIIVLFCDRWEFCWSLHLPPLLFMCGLQTNKGKCYLTQLPCPSPGPKSLV